MNRLIDGSGVSAVLQEDTATTLLREAFMTLPTSERIAPFMALCVT